MQFLIDIMFVLSQDPQSYDLNFYFIYKKKITLLLGDRNTYVGSTSPDEIFRK